MQPSEQWSEAIRLQYYILYEAKTQITLVLMKTIFVVLYNKLLF